MELYNREILKTWKDNSNDSIVLSIPVSISRQYGLQKPCHVILESREEGILVKKLNLEETKKK